MLLLSEETEALYAQSGQVTDLSKEPIFPKGDYLFFSFLSPLFPFLPSICALYELISLTDDVLSYT